MASIENQLRNLEKQGDDVQTQIYILAGVLGTAVVLLILVATILAVIAYNLTKQIKEDIRRRQISEEIGKRRFSAYTGEEVQRQLTAATVSSAVPLPSFQGPSTPSSTVTLVDASNTPLVKEFAFNTPNQGGRGVYTLQNPRPTY